MEIKSAVQMKDLYPDQESGVGEAFSRQSGFFDEIEKENEIVKELRSRFYHVVKKYVKPNGKILELNCGTGIDAIRLARDGFQIHATDISGGMLHQLRKKVSSFNLHDSIQVQQISFHRLDELKGGRFDAILSNFGGLNCTGKLDQVIHSFYPLLNENGIVILVVMPVICPWEIITSLKGNFKLAFRRFKRKGSAANVKGKSFLTHYYAAAAVKKMFGREYLRLHQEGWSSIMPMPYHEHFRKKFKKTFSLLKNAEQAVSDLFPFNHWADHVLIVMQKK